MSTSEYYSYLLRMWQVAADDEPAWRIVLENVQTSEKHGFASLEELLVYLRQVTAHEYDKSGKGSQTEVQG